MATIGAAAPLLATWYDTGNSRASAMERRVELMPGALRTLLEAWRAGRDVDGSIIDEAGFLTGIWNGSDIEVGLTARCGGFAERLGNAVALNLPEADGAALALYQPKVVRQVMAAQAECWEPQWATFTSHALRRAQQPPPQAPVVGWMTRGREHAEPG